MREAPASRRSRESDGAPSTACTTVSRCSLCDGGPPGAVPVPDPEVVAPHLRVRHRGEAVRERWPYGIGQHVRQAEADVEAERPAVPERSLDRGPVEDRVRILRRLVRVPREREEDGSGCDDCERTTDRTALRSTHDERDDEDEQDDADRPQRPCATSCPAARAAPIPSAAPREYWRRTSIRAARVTASVEKKRDSGSGWNIAEALKTTGQATTKPRAARWSTRRPGHSVRTRSSKSSTVPTAARR